MTEQDGSGRLPTSAWLGPYQLLGLLGAGGMGAVYKARDSRLDRIVAVKVLPERFAEDPTRRERFEREARAVAALNHPNICQLYDVGEAPGAAAAAAQRFLVMEYLEGQSLEERLLAGPLPIAEAVASAIDLADALDHAHRRGLVHRDLKPANVMLTTAGAASASAPQAKLLDFGISRLQAPADLPALETVTEDRAPLTADGTVLGTYPYMSPEQLAGREADARSDIFAFGAVLYEMVTGQRAFQGTTAATLIGAILHSDPPPIASRQPLAPAALERIVARCLAKDPDNRWQTARDLVLELKWIAEHPASSPEPGRRAAPSRGRAIRSAGMALAVAALILLALVYPRSEPADAPAVHLMFQPPKGVTLADPRLDGPVTISPDGRRLAFVTVGDDGRRRLWVRPIDSPHAVPLSGADGAAFPFWSPDSRFIGFFGQRKLKRVPAAGGVPQTLYDAIQPRGGAWGPDGTILFSAELGFQMYRGPADGGVATVVPPDGKNQERLWPSFLPDGRHFVYYGRPQNLGLFVGDLESTDTSQLLKDYVGGSYSSPGVLLALRGASEGADAPALLAQRFDPSTLQRRGEVFPIAEPVLYAAGLGRGAFSMSQTGTLVYANIEPSARRLTWFDRGGRVVAPLGGSDRYYAPALSPDGKTVVAARVDPDSGTPDLWAIDVARGISPRLTYDDREDFVAVWSPDGSSIVFAAQSPGTPPNLFQKAIREGGREEQLVKSRFNDQPNDWSPDGRFVVFARRDPQTQWDLWRLSMVDRTEKPFLRSPANEHLAEFSPDGTRVAYVSDESGTNEVYVDAFPGAGAREQISTRGGSQPRWRGDGRELFYIAPDGHLMSVAVNAGARFEPAVPLPLFLPRIVDLYGAENNGYARNYDASRDGQRFLISTSGDEPSAIPTTTVLLNWFARLPTP